MRIQAVRSRKDAAPEQTIGQVKAILDRLGAFTFEDDWTSTDGICHSVSLELDRLPLGAGGHGPGRPAALASAAAELAEQIQNLASPPAPQWWLDYGLMSPASLEGPERRRFADQRRVSLQTLLAEIPEVMSWLIEGVVDAEAAEEVGELLCVPYLRASDGELVHLPWDYLYFCCNTNGMCAGNSAAEALTHGLCEVIERLVLKQLFTVPPPSLPTIPLQALRGSSGGQLLEAVVAREEAVGRRVIVKDATLGGRLPVIGLLVIDADGGHYHFHLGADPDLSVALQRCVTEIYQGLPLEDKMVPLELGVDRFDRGPYRSPARNRALEVLRLTRDYLGPIPSALLFADGEPCHAAAFVDGTADNHAALDFVVGRLIDLGGEIYLRDVSFLGFPAYHVYLPGLSELRQLPRARLRLGDELSLIKRCLLRLKQSSPDEIRACAELIEAHQIDLVDHKIDPRTLFCSYTNVLLAEGADFNELASFSFLLALLFHRAGDRRRAVVHFADHVAETASDVGPGNLSRYYHCALGFFRLRAEDWPADRILGPLGTLFGDTLAAEVLADLGDPDRAFDNLTLPECGDCESCPVVDDCSYPAWRELQDAIDAQQRPMDQRALRRLINRHVISPPAESEIVTALTARSADEAEAGAEAD